MHTLQHRGGGRRRAREANDSFLIHENGPLPPQSYGSGLKILQRSFAWLITINISLLPGPSTQLLPGGTVAELRKATQHREGLGTVLGSDLNGKP